MRYFLGAFVISTLIFGGWLAARAQTVIDPEVIPLSAQCITPTQDFASEMAEAFNVIIQSEGKVKTSNGDTPFRQSIAISKNGKILLVGVLLPSLNKFCIINITTNPQFRDDDQKT